MFKRVGVVMIVLLLAGTVGAVISPVFAQGGEDFSGQLPAVEFPEGLDWINVPEPLTWDDLRGKVVLLDFWTYGCINCIHIIPDLERLEEEFAEELVVIGVHSAKFENEGETENIRQIVQRYEIVHPVVNDSEFTVWSAWGIRAWPTVMVVDPEGMVYGYHAGEGVYDVVQPIIAGMVEQFDAQGQINREPIELTPEMDARPETLLAFPGKVLADEAGGRLFIADTNHNRIVIADLETYEVLSVVGGLEAGNADGSFESARFEMPHGMTLSDDGTTLYVADTGNHLLRAIDLEAEMVTTVAGTGQQARFISDDGGIGTEVALNSPWDVVYVDGIIYIAMAGPHQLWRYDPATEVVEVHSGSGREGLVDHAQLMAQLAQPSGITSDGEVLYFADSEASAIREADIDPLGSVRTLVGTGLFDFGDVDGVGDAARLQHPLGVVYVDGVLYIADTYNSKIKTIDPETREALSFTGAAAGGYQDGALDEALFDEPGGITYAAGRLYVADTNNHAIRVIDLAAGTVETVAFPNPEALQAEREAVVAAGPFAGMVTTLDPQTVSAGESVIMLDVILPEGYKFNNLAEFEAVWSVEGDAVQIADDDLTQRILEPEMPLMISAAFTDGEAVLSVDLTIYYCEAVNETLCFLDRVRLEAPITVSADAESAPLLEHTVVPPEVNATF